MSRVEEFVRYHNGCDGECNGILLSAWADRRRLTDAERFDLAFMYATVYNIPSAIFMLEEREGIIADPEGWCRSNKGRLIFQSDRRYMRCNNALERTIAHYATELAGGERFLRDVVDGAYIDTAKSVSECQKWPNFGRFGAYLFTETLTYTMHMKSLGHPRFDFRNGATATSGLMNLFGFDCEADEFDRRKRIPEDMSLEQLDALLGTVAEEVGKSGGNTDYSCLETSLCAYRKFHKGTRYNGYYLDRQLEELVSYPSINPDSSEYINELYELRSELFPWRMLGECCGWDGVRSGMKRYYQRHGHVNEY